MHIMSALFLLIAFLILLALELLYFQVARRYNIVDRPSRRGSSSHVTLRGGGVVFYFGALLAFVAGGFSYPFFFVGLTLVATVSFIDDVRSLSPRLRLILQTVAVLLLLVQAVEPLVDMGRWSLAAFNAHQWGIVTVYVLVGLVAVTGAVDVFNFMDGINGITGGYALTALCALAVACGHTFTGDMAAYRETMVQLLVVTMLADVVFCFFNFRNRARCFAGDVGSISIAFIILFVLCSLSVYTEDVSWFAFLAVYGVDGCLTIAHRLMLREDITTPHRKHAFQIMANELHMPHVVVSLLYMAMQVVVDVAYFCCPGYPTLLLSVVVLSLAYVLFMKKYYRLHQG